MNFAKAFAPGNISCFFVIMNNDNHNPAKCGSCGAGFTVDKGVIVRVKKIIDKKINHNIIFFNNKRIEFPTVNSVIRILTSQKVEVKIKSQVPLECGFGISGASALAAAYALNKLLNLKKSRKELALTAHVAEAENSTGLGDVVNQYFGGFLIRYEPSYKFKAKKINLDKKFIYYKIFEKLDTKKIITSQKLKKKINSEGTSALKKIKKLKKDELTLANLIKISNEFAQKSRLLKNKKVISQIKEIESKGGNASMIMLGNSVFSDEYFKGSRKLLISNKSAQYL